MRLAVVIAAAILFKRFIADVYPVREQSMAPSLEGGGGESGARDCVLVDKASAWFRDPGRFQICVVRHRTPRSNEGPGVEGFFVKRVLGLPGELIDFRGGDLFIGRAGEPLARVPRAPSLVEAQFARVPAAGSLVLVPLDPKDGAIRHEGSAVVLAPEPGRALVARVRAGEGAEPWCIRDDHVENARVVRGRHAVPDVRVTLGPIDRGMATLAIAHELAQGDVRRVSWTDAGVDITAGSGGEETLRARFPGVSCEGGLRIETLDGSFRVLLPDGGGWRELFAEPRDTDVVDGFSGVRLEVAGGRLRLATLEVRRDVHYAWSAETQAGPQPIPPDRLFLVGDNPEVSTDSRDVGFGPVALGALVGFVRAVAWPPGRMRITR